jgi:uncharacterized membrane protein YphA (DoxX/SURF4 family)
MATTATATQGGKGLHIALWVVQVLLALVFIGAGLSKVATPLPELAKSLPYTADLPGALVRFIGAAEVTGALGLLLPSLFRILPILTPLAALGLTTIMVLATLFHISRSEWSPIGVTLALGALAGFGAWGRMKRAPITAR